MPNKRGGSSGVSSVAASSAAQSQSPTYTSYTEFPDEAEDGFNYAGDPQTVIDFFYETSNLAQIESNLSDLEYEVLQRYSRGDLMNADQYNDWDDMMPKTAAMLQVLDGLIDKFVLNQGVVVTRLSTAEMLTGKPYATLSELKDLEGTTIINRGVLSCSAAKEGLAIGDPDLKVGYKNASARSMYGNVKTVEYRIKIPPSKGAGMYIGTKALNKTWGADQREFIVARDTHLKVGKTTYDAHRDVCVVELEYKKTSIHGYGETGKFSNGMLTSALKPIKRS